MDQLRRPRPLELLRDPAKVEALLEGLRRRLLEELQHPDSAAGLARRLELPRQQVNYHLRELERVGLVELVEERRRGNFVERLLAASARRYVISPEVLGSLGDDPDGVTDHFSSAFLVAAAARILRDVGELQDRADESGERIATMTLPSVVGFVSADERDAFARELTEAVASLITRYHDASAPRGSRFHIVLGAYPALEPRREEGGGSSGRV